MIVTSIPNAIRDLGPSGCSLTRSGCLFGSSVAFWGSPLMCSVLEYTGSLFFVDVDLELFPFLVVFLFEVLVLFPYLLLGLSVNFLVLVGLLFLVLLFC